MKLRSLLLPFVILHSSSAILFAAPPPELTVLRQQYEKVYAERVTTVHEASVSALNTKFTTALDNAVAAAQRAGKLDDILAIQEDKKRLGEKLPIPDDDDKTPESLKKLRAIYREQLKKLEDTRAATIATVLPAYQTKLQDLETTLTKAGRIEEAKELRTYREGLVEGGAAAPPAAASGPSTAPAGASAPPGPAAAAKVKGDDRKAAEWLISLGAECIISDRGRSIRVTSPDELPKGRFSITKAVIDDRFTKAPVTATDLRQLTGLAELAWLEMGVKDAASEDFSFLATLPNLETLSVGGYPTVTDDVLIHLVDSRNLRVLMVKGCQVTGKGFERLAGLPNLNHIDAYNSKISDEGLTSLLKLRQLMRLALESTLITDASIPTLGEMPALNHLDLTRTQITAEALAGLKNAKRLHHLSFGKLAGKTPVDTAAILGPAFPKVANTRLTSSDSFTAADLAALSAFKALTSISVILIRAEDAWSGIASIQQLKSLSVERTPFSDVALAGVATHPGIERLELGASDLSDAGLLQLIPMKKLNTFTIRKSPAITEAGIAALRKARPDLKIVR